MTEYSNHPSQQEQRRPNGRYEYPIEDSKTAVVKRTGADGSPYEDTGWVTTGEIQHGDDVYVVVHKPASAEDGDNHPGWEKAVPKADHDALQQEVLARRAERVLAHLAGSATESFPWEDDETPRIVIDTIGQTLSAEELDLLRRRMAAESDTRPIDEPVVDSLNYLREVANNTQDRITPKSMGLRIKGALNGILERGEIPATDEKLQQLFALAARMEVSKSLFPDEVALDEVRAILDTMK